MKRILTIKFDENVIKDGSLAEINLDNFHYERTKSTNQLLDSLMNSYDVILLNFNNGNINALEALILQVSYTKNIPIIGVGYWIPYPFLTERVTKLFENVDEALQFIRG